MRTNRWIALSWLALGSLVSAQTPIMAGRCSLRSSSGTVEILVCADNPKPDDMWREAGIAACKDRQNCNAWIWDDAAKAPLKATEKDADLPQTSTNQAVAIWINDSKSLVKLKKVAEKK